MLRCFFTLLLLLAIINKSLGLTTQPVTTLPSKYVKSGTVVITTGAPSLSSQDFNVTYPSTFSANSAQVGLSLAQFTARIDLDPVISVSTNMKSITLWSFLLNVNSSYGSYLSILIYNYLVVINDYATP